MGLFGGHQYERRGTVVEFAGIRGGHGTVLLKGGLQVRYLFELYLPWLLVFLDESRGAVS